jgi:cellulose synthase/poly-beta-1,6-N-acetylglucosamine synthase-like glycosyltransferase
MENIFEPVLDTRQQRVLKALVVCWVVGTIAFWRWMLHPDTWVSAPYTLVNASLLIYVTGLPLWPFVLFLRMRQVSRKLTPPSDLRVAMVVTKSPSEPWSIVRRTLEAALEQETHHATWLADEQPTVEVENWCGQRGVRISSRWQVEGYHQPDWPRRRRCKEGNLAYFYDHFGYENYDVVVQLDADHKPTKGYLEEMLKPFNDPGIGYVAAPSMCDANAGTSWVARGRLYAESVLHGPQQLGLNNNLAPLCIGSHYAIRTKALKAIGGLGPELAEDHSTTLLMNAKGWRGAFAHRAICHGLGPDTFEDAMVQEMQWARSLTTILLSYTPALLNGLPWKLRLEFIYAQIFYPLRGLLSLFGLGLPVIALAINKPWMQVHYPSFLAFSGLQLLLTLLPVLYLRQQKLLQPHNAPLLSWEQGLFELTRGPWILTGVVHAFVMRWSPYSLDFKVTNKGNPTAPLPSRFLIPNLAGVFVACGVAVLLGPIAPKAQGYVLLTLINAALLTIAILAITTLSRKTRRRHHLMATTAIVLTLCSVWIRQRELLAPLTTPASWQAGISEVSPKT